MRTHALVALTACALLAGCGGRSPRHAPLSKAAFRAEANRICSTSKTRTARVARLRSLRPPAADAELYAHWLTAERDALAAAKALADTSKQPEGDPLVPLIVAEGKITGYALRLGASRCAQRTIGTLSP